MRGIATVVIAAMVNGSGGVPGVSSGAVGEGAGVLDAEGDVLVWGEALEDGVDVPCGD